MTLRNAAIIAVLVAAASCKHGPWRKDGAGFWCFKPHDTNCYATQADCQTEYDLGVSAKEWDSSLLKCAPQPVAYCVDFEYLHPEGAERNGHSYPGVRHRCTPAKDDCEADYDILKQESENKSNPDYIKPGTVTSCVEMR